MKEPGADVDLYPGSVELLLKVMREHAVSGAVLIQPSYYGWDNSYMMDCCDRYPGKFAAVVRVDQASPSAPDDLDFWVRQRGARGIRLTMGQYTKSTWRGGEPEFPLWDRIRELGIVAGYLINPHHADMVRDMLRKYPEVPVMIDHFGLPYYNSKLDLDAFERIGELAEFTQVYLKMSAMRHFSALPFPHEDILPLAERALQFFGASRILWATDFCSTYGAYNYREGIDIVERYMPFISAEEKEQLFYGTAMKLFDFKRV